MKNPIVLFPSRLGSTRLPGKPLADLNGEPMIVAVWRRAVEADIAPVVVATDSQAIADAIVSVGGRAVLTAENHPSGSDRIFEALCRIDAEKRHDAVINVQGDLPLLEATTLTSTLSLLDDPEVQIGTPVAEIRDDEDRSLPSVVKMVGSPLGGGRHRCLYFTRSECPWGEGVLYHHIGLYAWRRTALERFVSLKPTPLELREKLEQLRAIETGMRIDAVEVQEVPLGVDTQHDLDKARYLMQFRGGN